MDPQAFLRTWRIGATDCHQACTALVTGKDVSGPLMPSARLPFHPSLVDGAGPGAFCDGHALQDLEVWQILLVKPVERKTKCSFHPMLFVWNPLPNLVAIHTWLSTPCVVKPMTAKSTAVPCIVCQQLFHVGILVPELVHPGSGSSTTWDQISAACNLACLWCITTFKQICESKPMSLEYPFKLPGYGYIPSIAFDHPSLIASDRKPWK
jgi:hypothetical protein